jgi:hypothetical protein
MVTLPRRNRMGAVGGHLRVAVCGAVLVAGLAPSGAHAAPADASPVRFYLGCDTFPEGTICGTGRIVEKTVMAPHGTTVTLYNSRTDYTVTLSDGVVYQQSGATHEQSVVSNGHSERHVSFSYTDVLFGQSCTSEFAYVEVDGEDKRFVSYHGSCEPVNS